MNIAQVRQKFWQELSRTIKRNPCRSKTFGKGLVQNVVELDDGSGLKLTTATYFTPAGINIHKKELNQI